MKLRLGKGFWVAASAAIFLLTAVVVGRNAVHALKIKSQIRLLERQKELFRTRIERDSALIESLRYDDFLEEYAREHFHMQRRNEHVYILDE